MDIAFFESGADRCPGCITDISGEIRGNTQACRFINKSVND
jgi:hypothetical protein